MALPQNPGTNQGGQQPTQKPSVFGADAYDDDWGNDEFPASQESVTPQGGHTVPPTATSTPMPTQQHMRMHQAPHPQTPPTALTNPGASHPQSQPLTFQENDFGDTPVHPEEGNNWNPPSPEYIADQDEEEYDQPNAVQNSPFPPEIEESIELLLQAIASDDSTEVIMNGPNEVMMKREGVRYHIPDIKFHDKDMYHRVINEVVLPYTDTKDRIGDYSYLVEGQLELHVEDDGPPMLARVHMVAPPVVPHAKVTIAKKSRYAITLDDIQSSGSMSRGMGEFVKALALGRTCIIFSGLSGAGKTTMLEATSHHFDQNDRVIVVEDTPELRLPIADTVYMTASSNHPGADPNDVVSMEWLVKATNRMRPDRIIVGEVRGPEMSDFLVAANSGADGSMLTIHADNPRKCLDKILGLVMRSEGAKSENAVRRDIASTVQVIVQLGLIDGKHKVTHIEEISNVINQNTGLIASTPIFEYDRSLGRHIPRNRPSEELTGYLAQRGVNLNPAWFQQ